jgi:hypothetical protein
MHLETPFEGSRHLPHGSPQRALCSGSRDVVVTSMLAEVTCQPCVLANAKYQMVK